MYLLVDSLISGETTMSDSETGKETLVEEAKRMAREGRTIAYISEVLGIDWSEARSYLPNSS